MNLSSLMTRLKLKLGLLNISSPFVDIDAVILQILQDITVPTFSIYYPYKERLHVNLHDLELIEKTTSYEKVLLPIFQPRELLYVFDVNYNNDNLSGIGFYGSGFPMLQGNAFSQIALSNAGANLMSTMVPKITFHFNYPRTLYVYNALVSNDLILDIGIQQDKSLASIPQTCSESFFKLALLDMRDNLYPTLSEYIDVDTALAKVSSKIIEGMQDAESIRNELLEKWDDTYHLDFTPLYYA